MSNVETKYDNAESRMFIPADRVSEIKEYYFSRKLREVAKLNAEGWDIVSLGIGGPDRMPAAEVIDTFVDEIRKPGNHSYQPYVGIPELRRAMAEWYFTHFGVLLNPDNEILPLIGSKEGVLHTSLAFLNPGDGVLIPDPGYPTYTSVSRLVGAEIYKYNLREGNGWMPDFDELESLPLDKIKLMWVNYPHMPTGAPATMELFKKLVDFGRRHHIIIVNDNPYSFILNDEPLSILAVEGAREVAIELNSMSKSHNMSGWRVGMIASNPTFIGWILKVKSNIDSGQFKPLMLAAVKGLEAGEEWYNELNGIYWRRRRVAEQIMAEMGCSYDPAQRGLFLWGRVPDGEESGETLADRMLYQARVFITPGSVFGENGKRYVRLSLCADEDALNEALRRVRNINENK